MTLNSRQNARARIGLKSRLLMCAGISAVSTCASVLTFQEARAQTQGGLEEIVVSARKTDEKLMEVPISMLAVSSESIETRDLVSIEELSRYTPGFFSIFMNAGNGARNDRSAKQVTFRGFSTAPGIVFVDGAPVTGVTTGGVTPDFADIARVEVLKGPQNAYFGRSTFSGAVNYITRTPGNKFQGEVSAEYSSYNSNDLRFSMEGPLVADKLTARVVLHHDFQGGNYTNAQDTNQRLGDRQTDSISGSLYFTPTDALKVKGWISYEMDNDGPPAQTALDVPLMNCNLGGTGGAYYCGRLPTANHIPASIIGGAYNLDPFTKSILINNTFGFFEPFNPNFSDHFGLKRHAYQANFRADYETTGGYTISAVTSYNRNKQENLIDLTYGNTGPNPFYNSAPGAVNAPGIFPQIRWAHGLSDIDWVFNQEIRISSPATNRLRLLAGADYLHSYVINSPVYGYSDAGVAGLGSASSNSPTTKSIFAGAYYDVMPKLTLSGEVRYQWDDLNQAVLTNGSGTVVLATPTVLTTSFRDFAPRVSLDWKYAEDSLAYALWSRGFRPGGFNAGLYNQPQSILTALSALGGTQTYKEDTIDNFEIGLKSTWLDNTLQTRLALYYDQWRNGQVSNTLNFNQTNPNGSTTVSSFAIVQNVGNINLEGIELEADYAPTKHLLFNATLFASNNSIKGNFVCSDCVFIYGSPTIRPGTKLQFAPRVTGSFSAEYTDHLAGDYDWFFRGDYTYRGPFFADQANVASIGPSNNLNLRAGIRTPTYGVEVFVKNLTNDATLVQGTRGPDTIYSFAVLNEVRVGLPDKRQFGIRANYKF